MDELILNVPMGEAASPDEASDEVLGEAADILTSISVGAADAGGTESELFDNEDEAIPEPSDTAGREEEAAAASYEDALIPPESPPGEGGASPERPAAPADELEVLRSELERLRSELDGRRESYERMSREYDEFRELFPGRDISRLPDDVWESVRRGIPLAAAAAYEEAKRQKLEKEAAEVNRRNLGSSSGALDTRTDAPYYSPAEVRAMSASEVRSNYPKIMDSMKFWS